MSNIQRKYKEPVIHEVSENLSENRVSTLCGKWLNFDDYTEVEGKITCSRCLMAKYGVPIPSKGNQEKEH